MRSKFIYLPIPTQEYYCDSENGDDANDGTIISPLRTLDGVNSLLLSLGAGVSSSIRVNLKSSPTPYVGSSVDLSSNSNRTILIEPYTSVAGDGGWATIDSTSGTTFNSPRYEFDNLYLLRITVNGHPSTFAFTGYTRSRLFLVECELSGAIAAGNKYEPQNAPQLHSCVLNSCLTSQCRFSRCKIIGGNNSEVVVFQDSVVLGSVSPVGNYVNTCSIVRNIFISQTPGENAIGFTYRPAPRYIQNNIFYGYTTYAVYPTYYKGLSYGGNWLYNCFGGYDPSGAGWNEEFPDVVLEDDPLRYLTNGDYRFSLPAETANDITGLTPFMGPMLGAAPSFPTLHPLYATGRR